MGAWRPKHVEKVCSNKICILLHHVSVLPSTTHCRNCCWLIGITCQMHESPIRWALLFPVRFFGTQHAHSFLLTVWSWTVLCALSSKMSCLSGDVSELNASVLSTTGGLHDTHYCLWSVYLGIWVPGDVKSSVPYHACFPDITCVLYTTTNHEGMSTDVTLLACRNQIILHTSTFDHVPVCLSSF